MYSDPFERKYSTRLQVFNDSYLVLYEKITRKNLLRYTGIHIVENFEIFFQFKIMFPQLFQKSHCSSMVNKGFLLGEVFASEQQTCFVYGTLLMAYYDNNLFHTCKQETYWRRKA